MLSGGSVVREVLFVRGKWGGSVVRGSVVRGKCCQG